MAYRSLIAALFCFLASSVFAGYAQLKPPPGWTSGATPLFKPVGPRPTVAANGTMTAANDMRYGPGGVVGKTELSLTQPVSVNYQFQYAATAAAAAVSMLATNPAILASAVALPYIIEWLNDGVDPDNMRFVNQNNELALNQKKFSGACVGTSTDTHCTDTGAPIPAGMCTRGSAPVPPGYGPDMRCTFVGIPTNQPEWEVIPVIPSELPSLVPNPAPISPVLPWFLPNPLPVELPSINPAPSPGVDPVESPGPSPASRPFSVPQSDPVPVPNTNPQEYVIPTIKVQPSPVPSQPWRVSTSPENVPTDNPDPSPPVIEDPLPVPDPDPNDPGTSNPTDTPTDDFCAKNPTVIACLQKGDPGTLAPDPLHNEDKAMTIQEEPGFGPSTGQCPAPISVNVQGHQIDIPYTMFCEFADMLRPLVIAFAWLSAGFSFFGFARRD